MIERDSNISLKEYIIELCKNKEVEDMTFNEISNKIENNFGIKKNESTIRKWWTNYNEGYNDGYNDALSDLDENNIIDKIEDAKLQLQKEKYKLYDQRNELNKVLRKQARQEEIYRIIKESIENSQLQKLEYIENKNIKHTNNDLLCSLNDLHYGANINNNWNIYNSDICKEYIEKYIEEIIEIGKVHNSENCIVWANGDLISGNIHKTIAVSNKENVMEQVKGVSELIALFLIALSKHFNTVSFASVSGNHSRIDYKDDALKNERLDNLVEWYLQARLQNFNNISLDNYNKIDETMYILKIRGLNYVGVHGDYDETPSKLQSLQMMLNEPIYGVLTAHKHHNATNFIQGVKVIMAGSFLGMDDYCITKRIYGIAQQSISVCTNLGVKCIYDINFN